VWWLVWYNIDDIDDVLNYAGGSGKRPGSTRPDAASPICSRDHPSAYPYQRNHDIFLDFSVLALA
jgi:hypothetical protein